MLNLRKLHEALNASGLHLCDVAKRAGLSERTLRRIYSGQTRNPGISTIKEIARVLGVEPNEVIQ